MSLTASQSLRWRLLHPFFVQLVVKPQRCSAYNNTKQKKAENISTLGDDKQLITKIDN